MEGKLGIAGVHDATRVGQGGVAGGRWSRRSVGERERGAGAAAPPRIRRRARSRAAPSRWSTSPTPAVTSCSGRPSGRVENVTTPGPGTIVAGDVVDINLRGTRPTGPTPGSRRSSTACRSTAGRSRAERRGAAGAQRRRLQPASCFVPEDIEGGHLLCQQGFVYGMFARGGYTLTSSPRVCFTTEAAPPPQTTTTTRAAHHHDDRGADHHDHRASGGRTGGGREPVRRPPGAGAGQGRCRRPASTTACCCSAPVGRWPWAAWRWRPAPAARALCWADHRGAGACRGGVRGGRQKGQALANADKWEGLPPGGRIAPRGGGTEMRGRIIGRRGWAGVRRFGGAGCGDTGGGGEPGHRRSQAAQDVAADCEEATMDARQGGPDDHADRRRRPTGRPWRPGEDIRFRLTWDPSRGRAPSSTWALACVRVKGGLNPDTVRRGAADGQRRLVRVPPPRPGRHPARLRHLRRGLPRRDRPPAAGPELVRQRAALLHVRPAEPPATEPPAPR